MVRVAYHQGLLSKSSLSWYQWWAMCYHLSFANRNEAERQEHLVDSILRGSTRIFKPEVYDIAFPPSPLVQALRAGLNEEEEVNPEDFDSIDQFIRGLDDLKSGAILADDEGWM